MLRLKIFNIGITFVFLILSFGVFNLTFLNHPKYEELSKKNSIRLLPQEGMRGRIFDRNNKVLVDNKICYDVAVLPQEAEDLENTLMKVAKILDVDFQRLKSEFKNGYAAPFAPVTITRDIDIKKAIRLEELRLELGGVIIQPKLQRHYPYGGLASHILGYLDEIDLWRLTRLESYGYKTKDIVGFGGVEERYDYYLRHQEGGLSVEVDHRSRFKRVLGYKPPRNGKDIQLTIDLELQKIVENNLKIKGCVIIMEPYTGEILALASYPNFLPSLFLNKKTYLISSLFNNPEAPLLNRAISGLYPAGSVFKLILASCALQLDKFDTHKTFFCSGMVNIGRQKFSCWDNHGTQNLFSAIVHSCNIFFYRLGTLLGPNLIHEWALKFGLSKPTGIDLPYEKKGFVPSPILRRVYKLQNWFEGDTANLSIGQGELLVTPLQMLRVMSVFANKGFFVRPYIVKAIDNRDISDYQRRIVPFGLREKVLTYIRDALRSVVSNSEGTAHVLADLPVAVAGKTGTAQVEGKQSHSWFVGFFPFEKPRFTICVFLENGGPGYYACLLAKDIIKEMYNTGLLN